MSRQRLIKRSEARRGLYVDFEGRAVEGEPPVLLGVLYEDGSDSAPVVRQFMLDPTLNSVARTVGVPIQYSSTEAALNWLISLSNEEQRHVISWSRYDRDRIKELSSDRAFRYRNAIPTAKTWLRRQGIPLGGPHELRRYEELIGYERPIERFAVAESIHYIRQRSAVTPGAADRWKVILGHNLHDLLAMREIVLQAVGLG